MLVRGAVDGAREDTLGLWLDGQLVDLAQHGVDLEAGTPGIGGYLDPDPLRGITGASGREVLALFDWSSSTNACVMAHALASDLDQSTWAIIAAGGQLLALQGTDVLAALEPTTSPATLLVVWSSRPNPDATGASDAVLSTIELYEVTGDVWHVPAVVAHAAATSDGARALHVGGAWDGSTFGAQVPAMYVARVSSAPDHTAAEAHQTFVAPISPGADDPSPIAPMLPPDIVTGEPGEWAGAANVGWAAATTKSLRRAGGSPLVAEVHRDAGGWGAGVPLRFMLAQDGWLLAPLLRYVDAPAWATHAVVRVHARQWGTEGEDPTPARVRVSAWNRLPAAPQLPAVPLDAFHVTTLALEYDDGEAGRGRWLPWPGVGDEVADHAVLRLPRATHGGAHVRGSLVVGISIRWDAGPDLEAARLAIRAWSLTPLHRYIGGTLS